MRLGRLHLQGPQAWPDQVLDVDGLCVGAVVEVWRLAFGFEVRCSTFGGAAWLDVYLGWWCFEVYLDIDGEYVLEEE